MDKKKDEDKKNFENNIIKKRNEVYSRKGVIEDIPWVVIIVITGMVAFTVLILMRLFFELPFTPGNPFSYDITFVDLVNKPYLVASIVGNKQFEDRIFFEHALQAAVVESLENSNSESVPTLMDEYLRAFNLKYYSVIVRKKGEKILEINSLPKRCGESSFCVPKSFKTDAGICNVGRVETQEECGSSYLCCKEDIEGYKKNSDALSVVACGEDSAGICSAELELSGIIKDILPCGWGRLKIKDVSNNCKDINGGKTPVCCAPVEVAAALDVRYSAKIPLIYKDHQAVIEVTVR